MPMARLEVELRHLCHAELRKRMKEKHMRHDDLAEQIDRSRVWLTFALGGRREFSVNDAWAIMEALDIDPQDMYIYFPRCWG